MKQFRHILLLFLGWVSAAPVQAKWAVYTSSSIASSQMSALCQDRYGYLWMGTEYGLTKYDAYRFTNYYSEASDTASLPDNSIVCFLSDSKGRLWIGTNKGVALYDYMADTFHRVPLSGGVVTRIGCILETASGEIFLGTIGYGLWRMAPGEQEFTRVRLPDGETFFMHLYEDGRGRLWKSDPSAGVTCYERHGGAFARSRRYPLAAGPAVSFVPHRDGDDLQVVCTHGIMRWDKALDRMVPTSDDMSALGAGNTIHHALLVSDGSLLAGTSQKGVMQISPGSRRLEPRRFDNAPFRVEEADVNQVLEDRGKGLWLSCYNKGVCYVSEQSLPFRSWNVTGIPSSVSAGVSSVVTEADGGLWCTVSHGGVYRLSPEGGTVASPVSPPAAQLLHRDAEGRWWLATDKMLYAYQPLTGASVAMAPLRGWGVRCMTDTGDGTVFVSDFGYGLVSYDTRSGRMDTLTMADGMVCNDWVLSMTTDKDGRLWIGTADGISLSVRRDGRFVPLLRRPLLKGRQIFSFCVLSSGDVLIGGEGRIYRCGKKTGIIRPLALPEKMRRAKICDIVEARDGDFWVSSTQGLWHFGRKTGRWSCHFRGNGLTTHEYIARTGFRLVDGRIGFGTGDGLTVFRPQDLCLTDTVRRDLVMTRFETDGVPVGMPRRQLSLPNAPRQLVMEFSLMDYRQAENISLLYCLNPGKDETWSATEAGQNQIRFNRLPAGKYQLAVKAVSDGREISHTLMIPFRVLPPWYLMPWALAVYLLMLMAVSTLLYYVYLKRKERQLVRVKMRQLTDAANDIRTPLTLILSPAEQLCARLTTVKDRQYARIIRQHALHLRRMIDDVADQNSIDRHLLQLNAGPVRLEEYLRQLLESVREETDTDRIHLEIEADVAMLRVWVDGKQFGKALLRLVRHALSRMPEEGMADVIVSLSGQDGYQIVVRDSGQALSSKRPWKIFDRFTGGKTTGSIDFGTGLEMSLTKEIITMHGGEITYSNRQDGVEGAQFVVTLPVVNERLRLQGETAKADTPTRTGNKPRILLAERDAALAGYLLDELGGLYALEQVNTCHAAYMAIRKRQYDLVIVGTGIDDTSGLELVRGIKTMTGGWSTPVILMTDDDSAAFHLKAMDAGADERIIKPFTVAGIRLLIDRLIRERVMRTDRVAGKSQLPDVEKMVRVVDENAELKKRIYKAVIDNIGDCSFNVNSLSSQMNLTRTQLNVRVKELFGMSTIDYINGMRMKSAAKVLRTSRVTMKEAAYSVGYSSQSHFCIAFKKYFGITPSDYAENNRIEKP